MELYTAEYYDDFHCLAGACPDSCCHEWTVDIDEDAAALYRALPGPLGDRLRAVLQDTPDGPVMVNEHDRCPMWREDGLCQIQAELGHDALSSVCREYPRLHQDYGDFQERSLELSCPEAARLILSGNSAVCRTHAEGGQAEYDPEAMKVLLESRETALSYVLSGQHPLPQTLAVMLLYGHEVQAWLDGCEKPVFDPQVCLRDAQACAGAGDLGGVLAFFEDLEILTQRWQERLRAPAPCPWDDRFRPLVCYFLRRYWLQAVWDYDLVCRVKFLVTACLLIRALGGDLRATAQLFSKEIENDLDNLEALFQGAYNAPALTDENLLGLLVKNATEKA